MKTNGVIVLLTLGRADTNAKAVDETADHEHTNILRGTRDYGTNTPDNGTNLNGSFATEDVGELQRP
jgi:hypothetical protein